MLAAIALIPSAPVLVPDLASAAAVELADLRTAISKAAQSLPRRWVAVGVGHTDVIIGPEATGTFAGYGSDVRVALSAQATAPASDLPLCALMAGWLRGIAAPRACAQVRVYSGDHDACTALARGRALRTAIDESADQIGVLVLADGANTLTPSAPGGHLPESVPQQTALDDALAAGDIGVLSKLPAYVVGRVAYQVLAGLAGPAPASAVQLYRGAPYGVGYFAGVWTP